MLPATQVQSLQVSATLLTTHSDSHLQDSHSNHERKGLPVILKQSLIFWQQAGEKPECPIVVYRLLSFSSCSVLLSLHGGTVQLTRADGKDHSAPNTTVKAALVLVFMLVSYETLAHVSCQDAQHFH